MITVYLETNYVMAIATGRDPGALKLLDQTPADVDLVMPLVSIMEAYQAFEEERRRTNAFINEIDRRISDVRRKQELDSAERLLDSLETARIAAAALLNDMETLLHLVIDRLSARARWITLDGNGVRNQDQRAEIDDPTDNLILAHVLSDAARVSGVKAFLTENIRDFDAPSVRDVLRSAGVEHYFPSSAGLLGWLGSQLKSPDSSGA